MGSQQSSAIQENAIKARRITFQYIPPIQFDTMELQAEDECFIYDRDSLLKAGNSTTGTQLFMSQEDLIRGNIESSQKAIQRSELRTSLVNSLSDNAPTVEEEKVLNEQTEKIIEEVKVRWNSFIKVKKKNFLDQYHFISEIGRGGYGCVYKAIMKYTGLYRAAKKIQKSGMKKDEHEKLFSEMVIMSSLDHPNIIKLYEVYDFRSQYVLILELCDGGELYKRIISRNLREKQAAKIMKQLLRALIYLHANGIVHRDIKPENMLFEKDTNLIKIIDFGIACKKAAGQRLKSRIGTPYYIAPEVILKNYDQKCDIWSCGIIIFMIVNGHPPFMGRNQDEVLESILKEDISFNGSGWAKFSKECRDFVMKLLEKNPNNRPNAEEAFKHPWLAQVEEYELKEKHRPFPFPTTKSDEAREVFKKISSFHFKNKLQAVVHTYIVSQLFSSADRLNMIRFFKEMDINNDGVISSDQLLQALQTITSDDHQHYQIEKLLKIIDTNGSGKIDFTEFLVAGIDTEKITKNHLEKAFAYFDIDHNGSITIEEVTEFLENTSESAESIRKMFDLVDTNGDGEISKEEFVSLLSDGIHIK